MKTPANKSTSERAKPPEVLRAVEELKSEVEKNRDFIRPGDVLFYIDDANVTRYEVREIFDGGFSAEDDYETKDFYFHELQKGWQLSEDTKENHRRLN